ncbi:MAG: hypothetical protein QM840_10000, partial [Verrucomicrobiota bacterium]|nr:hypothetical protein [Verrucomicrobiota bacterium]
VLCFLFVFSFPHPFPTHSPPLHHGQGAAMNMPEMMEVRRKMEIGITVEAGGRKVSNNWTVRSGFGRIGLMPLHYFGSDGASISGIRRIVLV